MSWFTSELRVWLIPFHLFKPSSDFCKPFRCGASYVDPYCFLCFAFVFAMLSSQFLAALWSHIGKGLTSWPSYVLWFLVFCHSPIWCSGSGMVLDWIDSWYLPSSLLILICAALNCKIYSYKLIIWYRKTCVKRPLSKRRKLVFQDQLSLYWGSKYCRMLCGAFCKTFDCH